MVNADEMRRFFKIWAVHAAMNFGALLNCIFYGALPPQCTKHDAEALASLEKKTIVEAFIDGLG